MRALSVGLLFISFAFFTSSAFASSDRDGMPAWWENKYKLNPNKNDGHRDPDADGLSNKKEFRLRINPRLKDTNRDGMDDGVEVRFGFNPRRPDAEADKDSDGIKNIDEIGQKTTPPSSDAPSDPPPPADAAQGVFVVNCSLTERKNLDPLIAPGRPGAFHEHEFFGPTSVGDYDLPADLIEKPTSCGLDADRSAYWMPSLLNHGQLAEGDVLQAYYFLSDRARAFPRGLAMIAGKPYLSTSDPQSASWSCQPSTNYGQTSLPACPAGNFILSEVRFPSCWNGRDLDSADHRSHMAYRNSSDQCPSSHPVELPELVLFRNFTQYDGLLDSTSLSSGSTGGLHADFVSGWNEQAMTDLITSCRNRNCSRVGNQVPGSLLNGRSARRVKTAGLKDRLFCRLTHS